MKKLLWAKNNNEEVPMAFAVGIFLIDLAFPFFCKRDIVLIFNLKRASYLCLLFFFCSYVISSETVCS